MKYTLEVGTFGLDHHCYICQKIIKTDIKYYIMVFSNGLDKSFPYECRDSLIAGEPRIVVCSETCELLAALAALK